MTDSLCPSCLHVRPIVSGTGSKFWLCQLSQHDRRYPKYPRQPMIQCPGYSAAQHADDARQKLNNAAE